MGNLIFGTTTVQGRTFDDIKIQTSKAGVPRPIVFGRARPIVGNIIATTSPRIVAVREEQDGGKGGPSVEVENEEVYRTYAIRICEGPVTGIRRVWRNNELVYDRDSTDPTQLENNAAFLEKAEFFLGGYDQMPSAVMQSAFGMDNVHAYRGTCYMVVDDENLTATGGAIPQYAFEVERSEGFFITSRPYAVEEIDGIGVNYEGFDAGALWATTEAVSSSYSGFSAELRVLRKSAAPTTEAFSGSYAGFNADLRVIRKEVSQTPEAVTPAYIEFSAQLEEVVIYYTEEPEVFASSYTGFNASLETP